MLVRGQATRPLIGSTEGRPTAPTTSRRAAVTAGLVGVLLSAVGAPSLRAAATEERDVAPPTSQPADPQQTLLGGGAHSSEEAASVQQAPGPASTGSPVQADRLPASGDAPPVAPALSDKTESGPASGEEDERRKQRRRKRGRIRELEEIRAELAEKELVLIAKQQELLDKEQTLLVLQQELDIERKLRALLTKEKEKAEEEAALAMGLCTGGSMLS
ncbi:hypothetical protein WJX81_005928 [Elliptochloris bilobata]|uniref:Uncharacterized protein n=1 Tax=Elliptochloris bilobata TaxID=381761 RepID=A0AAW1RKL1_9CHLO